MYTGVHCIRNRTKSHPAQQLIDIVAVHDVGQHCVETWTHLGSKANWIRDFLPQDIPNARILTFAYEASSSSFFGSENVEFVRATAESFVQDLFANRRSASMLSSPIIFICHGLGGIIVKKALAYSSTRDSPQIQHLIDIYTSTYAIMFFGTPQDRTQVSHWANIETPTVSKRAQPSPGQSELSASEGRRLHRFDSIEAEFAPHTKRFRMIFFWETQPTLSKHGPIFVVDNSAAVMRINDIEKVGIDGNHKDMVKFESRRVGGYRTVVDALSRYCQDATGTIQRRWTETAERLRRQHIAEANELDVTRNYDHFGNGGNDVQTDQRRPSGVSHFFPPVDAIDNYIGREDDLSRLHGGFFPCLRPPDNSKRHSFVIHGMGGSGKTQLSSKYAQIYRSWYTAVFSIHAASSKTIEDSLSRIAAVGGLHPTVNAGWHFLNQQQAPWLLIIDNADDPSRDPSSLFPSSSSPHIIVTTKNPRFRQVGSLGSIELRGLAETEALDLLLTRAEISQPWDAPTKKLGSRIAKTLGYLALALIHAGNCVCQKVCTLEGYLRLHSASRSDMQRRRTSFARSPFAVLEEEDMVGAVYSTFDISVEYLQKRRTTRNRDAIELLKISAYFHFEQIPEAIFTRAVKNRRNTFEQSFASSIISWLEYFRILHPAKMLPRFLEEDIETLSESRITWALDVLQSLSLISRDAHQESFSMHPLVHQWARDKLTAGEKETWSSIAMNTILESVELQLGASKNSDGEEAALEGSFYQVMLPHLNACLQERGSPISASTFVTASTSTPMWLITLILEPNWPQKARVELVNAGKCATVFGDRGQFDRAATYLSQVKDVLFALRGPRNEMTMRVTSTLSNLYWGLGRLEESIGLHNSVVHARMSVNGPDDVQTLVAMSDLGRTYWLHGDYVQSLSVLESTSQKMHTVLGPDDPVTLDALDEYGVALGSWYRFKESMDVHQRVLKVRERSLGSEHPKTISTMMNLAMALLDLGRLDEAEKLMSYVHHQRQTKLGKEHPWTLWALCYLTKVYIEQQNPQKAEELLTWGIEAGKRSLDKHHLGVLMGQGYLALAYAKQGKHAEALALTLSTLEELKVSRGIAHPDTVFCQWKLALLYKGQDQIPDAVEQCEQALQGAYMRITGDHPLTRKIKELLNDLQESQSTTSAVQNDL